MVGIEALIVLLQIQMPPYDFRDLQITGGFENRSDTGRFPTLSHDHRTGAGYIPYYYIILVTSECAGLMDSSATVNLDHL